MLKHQDRDQFPKYCRPGSMAAAPAQSVTQFLRYVKNAGQMP